MNAGNKIEGAFRKSADTNKTEEEKLIDAQNKELRACLTGDYSVKCEKDIFLKKCDVSLFQEAELYVACNTDAEFDIYHFYAKGINKNGEQFKKELNIVRSKRQ